MDLHFRLAVVLFHLPVLILTLNSPVRAQGRIIWSGESGGHSISWTTSELDIRSRASTQKIFAPLFKKGLEDFTVVYEADEGTGHRSSVKECTYEHSYRLLSVVGTLVSFEDRYYDYCGGAHPSADTRFTSIDLSKSGNVFYARKEDTPMMDVDLSNLGKIVRLTDFFNEQDILRALLEDSVIKKALADSQIKEHLRSLSELPELFAKDFYGLGETGFELRPDYLTRFAFYQVEGNRVAIRIGLPPHYGANKTAHLQIGIWLPIPDRLKAAVNLASKRKEGFLMKDAQRIAQGKSTTLRNGNH